MPLKRSMKITLAIICVYAQTYMLKIETNNLWPREFKTERDLMSLMFLRLYWLYIYTISIELFI